MNKYNPYKWHFITERQTPHWVRHKFGISGTTYHGAIIEETVKHIKGKHYEYKWVIVSGEHTHDDAIIRRKLKH
jgi:hypothetical protein